MGSSLLVQWFLALANSWKLPLTVQDTGHLGTQGFRLYFIFFSIILQRDLFFIVNPEALSSDEGLVSGPHW